MTEATQSTPRAYAEDPSRQLESVFEAIYWQRMQGVDLINPLLPIKASGFRLWEGSWVGTLLTPWFLNLMVLPADSGCWEGLACGERRGLRFPAGEFPFAGGHEPGIGDYLFCSLMSPVGDLTDPLAAVELAEEVMTLLMTPPEPAEEEATMAETPEKALPCATAARGLSRRDFLRGGSAALDDARLIHVER
ncbi:[NiFe]-hydrogenase assembly chaperone HybE [Halomonas faecis]|uniref:[NiFe]-hydrogenase assembly chaperone HybE n=1 Tax=Halomonas faecis TaxID=1562110 RepID=UPI0013D12BA4|nr:[NiFe]-hydrogenase assembly chaperone HybE [Halomonas faecis]